MRISMARNVFLDLSNRVSNSALRAMSHLHKQLIPAGHHTAL